MPFQKGVPQTHVRRGGRPKGFRGLAKMIAKETRDGRELVEYALEVFRGEKTMRHEKWEALQWLADRGFGKPLTMIDLDAAVDGPTTPVKLDLAKLNAKQRADLRAVLQRALGRPEDAGTTATGKPLRLITGELPETDE